MGDPNEAPVVRAVWPEALAASVSQRLAAVRERIAHCGGDPDAVRIVAVTKGFGPDALLAAHAAGLGDVGENYAGELLAKRGAIGEAGASMRWHYLGAIQRNKVARLAPFVDCWQGVCRAVEGEAIAAHRPGAEVLVQVAADVDSRRGVAPAEVPALVASLSAAGLAVRGLMTVAPPGARAAREVFRRVRELADALALPERSMGMSEDLEAAIAEGTTMLRLGRALFGPRPPARGAPVRLDPAVEPGGDALTKGASSSAWRRLDGPLSALTSTTL